MISEDKITVVIPTKNRENFLKFSLASVLNQSYKNLEIIILDNNSSDNTKKYIDSIVYILLYYGVYYYIVYIILICA